MTTYSPEYEETQGFSELFRDYYEELAADWVKRHDLVRKRVVEIGCGKGEFLVALARVGISEGVGIDPGVDPQRIEALDGADLRWVSGFFPADFPVLDGDAVVCRHTLEHIPDVRSFLRGVRSAIGDRSNTTVLFELPDTLRVLNEAAFWDVYYEHCSYFSAGSLARLFRVAGFEVTDLARAYHDQYLLIEARPSTGGPAGATFELEDDLEALRRGVEHFASVCVDLLEHWRYEVAAVAAAGRRSVLWGAGSKGVAFLAGLGDQAVHVAAAVDINPFKQGKYMAGSGHRIIAPDELSILAPELVVAMNPVYEGEIQAEVDRLGLQTRLVSV
jgi:SAM-dependent methyltransferase